MRVCVIGAGPSGLCAAKEIKEANPEAEITILEKTRSLGGVFAASYQGLTMVNNPLLVNFSDFLAEEALPALEMWKAEHYVAYLRRYAEAHAIDRLIEYSVTVKQARWDEGKWRLDVVSAGVEKNLTYDYLVVCSGSNSAPNLPQIPGEATYAGDILYANDIKDPAAFHGKNVVFIGLGESGSDLSDFVSRHARSATVSLRRWSGYIIPRYHDGRPTDLNTSKIHHCLPAALENSMLGGLLNLKRRLEFERIVSAEDKKIQALADHTNHRWPEAGRLGPFRRISTKSCGFVRAHLDGRVRLKPAIARLQGRTAYFNDGSSVDADAIIVCAGYRQKFPFLDAAITANIPSSNVLYKYMFPVDWQDRLAFIGFVRPSMGTVPVLSELQSRLLGLFLARKLTLPSQDRMLQDIAKQKAEAQQQFPADFQRVGHLVDYYGLSKNLATEIGVMPNQWKLFCTDMKLWYKVNYSFLCPGMFRLYGPGQKYNEVADVLKSLPTMPSSVLFIESLLYVVCRILESLGLRQFAIK